MLFLSAAFGLPPEGFVFCSFNQSYKVDRAVFTCWMRLLGALPGSVLWMLVTGASARENLRAAAAAAGIDPRRLVFASPCPKAEHLGRHRFADLFLDTWCVNGGTTEPTITPPISVGVIPTCANSAVAIRPSSSAVRSRRVWTRQLCARRSPSNSPRTMLVLPTSIASSIVVPVHLSRHESLLSAVHEHQKQIGRAHV